MYFRNKEPTIEELLNDEITRLIMARDGFDDHTLRALFRDVQRRLEALSPAAKAPPSGCAA